MRSATPVEEFYQPVPLWNESSSLTYPPYPFDFLKLLSQLSVFEGREEIIFLKPKECRSLGGEVVIQTSIN